MINPDDSRIFNEALAFALSSPFPTGSEEPPFRQVIEGAQRDGYCGIGLAAGLGGRGYGYLQSALTYEALAHRDPYYSFAVQLHNNITLLADRLGENPEIKAIVRQMVAGTATNAFALTEGTAGSDPMSTAAYGVEKEDGFHVYGEKQWITNACDADYFTLMVKTEPGDGMVMLLGNGKTPGLTTRPPKALMAGGLLAAGGMVFDDFVVPHSMLLTRRGFQEALASIDVARIFVPAICVGLAQRALDLTARYLAGRQSLGDAVLRNSAIQWRLGELDAKVEAARQLVYHTASLMDSGQPVSETAAKNKLFGPQVAMEVATQCMQYHGAEGFLQDSWISRAFTAAKMFSVIDGSSEIQQLILGRAIYKKARQA